MSEYIVELDGPYAAGYHVGEEIVRCRDCEHFTPEGTHMFEDGKTNVDYCKYVRGWMLQITPDGYCAWGVKRKEGGDD